MKLLVGGMQGTGHTCESMLLTLCSLPRIPLRDPQSSSHTLLLGHLREMLHNEVAN